MRPMRPMRTRRPPGPQRVRLRVRGTVARRPPGTENAKLATGEIELQPTAFEVLSAAKTPPF